MAEKILRVYLQLTDRGLHPLSRKILTTARALSAEGSLRAEGVTFTDFLSLPQREALEHCGLEKVTVWEGEAFAGFLPESQLLSLKTMEIPKIFLFPATPEGRTLSAMLGAALSTGVTADCTALSFTETGNLLQTRPAFSGSRLAQILTKTEPVIASLRFGMPVPEPRGKTKLQICQGEKQGAYPAAWLDRAVQREEKLDAALVIGGGIRKKEDIPLFEDLAKELGAELYCSRVLTDRGWMEKSRQIGLSGGTLSAKLVIALGISGSLPFQAGLGEIDHLVAVDQNPDTALMARADTPIEADLYQVADALRKA